MMQLVSVSISKAMRSVQHRIRWRLKSGGTMAARKTSNPHKKDDKRFAKKTICGKAKEK